MAPPAFSHTLSLTFQISKILPFLVVNTCSIFIGPSLKNFLPTPMQAGSLLSHSLIKQLFVIEIEAIQGI